MLGGGGSGWQDLFLKQQSPHTHTHMSALALPAVEWSSPLSELQGESNQGLPSFWSADHGFQGPKGRCAGKAWSWQTSVSGSRPPPPGQSPGDTKGSLKSFLLWKNS